MHLYNIHQVGLVHCDLHGGNIVMHDRNDSTKSLICDLGLSRSVNSRESNSTIRGGLPYIAPEVFHTRKFTQKSDVYSFGIIMHLMATGESPFRDRQFDTSLIREIMDVHRCLIQLQRNTKNLPSGVVMLILINVHIQGDFGMILAIFL